MDLRTTEIALSWISWVRGEEAPHVQEVSKSTSLWEWWLARGAVIIDKGADRKYNKL
jgi:hypothetical protein